MPGKPFTSEQEVEAQLVAKRIRQAAGDELRRTARLVFRKLAQKLLSAIALQLNDLFVNVATKVYEEYLREKDNGCNGSKQDHVNVHSERTRNTACRHATL